MITTYHYRIKDSGKASRVLSKMSGSVNMVWNFCKQTQKEALLRWRGRKSLGWIPFKSSAIKIHDGKISYNKNEFSFWNSRELPKDAKIKTGLFCQDKRIDRLNLRKNALVKLRYLKRCQKFAQRKQSKSKKYYSLPKAKQERKLHVKVANIRQDYLHKESTKLVKKCSLIVVGDVPCNFLNCNKKLSGISLDSGIGMFKNMLKYKAVRAASLYKEISKKRFNSDVLKV